VEVVKIHPLAYLIFTPLVLAQTGCAPAETEGYDAKQIAVEQDSPTPPPMNPPMNEGQSNK
jgi:hypothetical protein